MQLEVQGLAVHLQDVQQMQWAVEQGALKALHSQNDPEHRLARSLEAGKWMWGAAASGAKRANGKLYRMHVWSTGEYCSRCMQSTNEPPGC